jgi:hypothetical protein
MQTFLQKHLDDLLALAGCALLLYGTYELSPLAVWFVGGGMCLIASVLWGIGQKGNQ